MSDEQSVAESFPVGKSAAVSELDLLMRQVARYDSTVLIQGESGCGKELAARRIHELSARGDMSLDMQVKLLRVLQERTFERVGSAESRRANVRILAATHRDLESRVAAGEFREDLFFRLNVFPIRVPALRDRADDLPQLIEDLVRRGEAAGRPGIRFSETAMACLRSYRWPGNVRELQNLVERLAILYPGRTIERHDLPDAIGERRRQAQAQASPTPTAIPSGGIDLREHLGTIEKQLIRSALDQTDGTVAHAARLLNLRRTTLVEKLRKYDLQARLGPADLGTSA